MKNIKKKQQIYLNPNTMNDYEKEIDKFIQKETDKKSKEQDEKLKKAEEKRLKLLFETYDSRKTELMKKSH